MDYKQQIIEGVKHATWSAQKRAVTNCVYVCTNKEKKQFDFVPLEDVVLYPNTENEIKLSTYLLDVQRRVQVLEKQNNSLNKAIERLAEYVDSQRFL